MSMFQIGRLLYCDYNNWHCRLCRNRNLKADLIVLNALLRYEKRTGIGGGKSIFFYMITNLNLYLQK